jgi:hypothetical protein
LPFTVAQPLASRPAKRRRATGHHLPRPVWNGPGLGCVRSFICGDLSWSLKT